MAMPATPNFMNPALNPPVSVTITPVFSHISTVKSEIGAQDNQQDPLTDLATCVKCDFCEYRCSKKDRLTRHVRNVHYKEKPYGCELCDASFGRKDKLKRHMNTVHSQDRPYKCDFCAHSSGRKDKIREHIQSVHLKSRPPRPKKSHKKKPSPVASNPTIQMPNVMLPQHPIPPQDIQNHLHFMSANANNLVTLTPLPSFVPTNYGSHPIPTPFQHPQHLVTN